MNGRVYDTEELFLPLEECLPENVCEGPFLSWSSSSEPFSLCRASRILLTKGLSIACAPVGKKSLNNNTTEEFDK